VTAQAEAVATAEDPAPELAVAPAEMSPWALNTYLSKYSMDLGGGLKEEWRDTARRVTANVMGALGYRPGDPEFDGVHELIADRRFVPGGRYLYASGRPLHQVNNCTLYRAEDSREGWSDLLRKTSMALMTGAGIGVVYSDLREAGAPILKTGGVASGPLALMQMVNEVGRHVMQGGARRSAIWAGLHWDHPDALAFVRLKDWDEWDRYRKEDDFSHPLRMEMTNISVILDRRFFEAYHDEGDPLHGQAKAVYWETLRRMLKTAEPGFSVDFDDPSECLRNACTEITSSDDSDVCNLGSLNLARFESRREFKEAVRLATLFLIAGTVYSDVPHEEIGATRAKNRRLGLGVMGVHEWLLRRGERYEPSAKLGLWLDEYARSGRYADEWADLHGLSRPVKTRAVAPTGTIGIIAETTTGIEPIFCAAYKRRFREASPSGPDRVLYQYVIDPTARRLVEEYGIEPSRIEDAYSLAEDVERRVAFQAWVQGYVDHGISSTINLPETITDDEGVTRFGEMLMKYLPELRGVTVYPDGARAGQPITPVSYVVAASQEGVTYEEEGDRCVGGACGT